MAVSPPQAKQPSSNRTHSGDRSGRVGSETDPMQCSALPCPARLLASPRQFQVCRSLLEFPRQTKPTSGSPYPTEDTRGVQSRGAGLWLGTPSASSPVLSHYTPLSPPQSANPAQILTMSGFGGVGWHGIELQPCNLLSTAFAYAQDSSEFTQRRMSI